MIEVGREKWGGRSGKREMERDRWEESEVRRE